MKKIILLSALFIFSVMSAIGQAYPDRHNTSYTDAWVSCEEAESPNIKRDPGHWIMYDFGDQYSLHESTIWNFNVPDTTSRGMNDIVIDYSNDGETWIELGEYTVNEAPGSSIYQGEAGPDFGGVVAKYILISILSTHGDATCAAMSEFRVNATVATSTNVPNKELALELAANPNPASEFTMIQVGEVLDNLQYSLVDMSGKLLRQGRITNTDFRLNTSALASGAYTLTVHNQEGNKSILVNVINN
jgi:hypothetical protein